MKEIPGTHRPDPPGEDLRRAGVVHDVNQMLSVIAGRAGLLLRTGRTGSWVRDLQAIELAATDAAAMLDRLTEADPEHEAGSVSAAAEAACLVIRPAPDGNWRVEETNGGGWTLVRTIPDDLWAQVPEQVLREVLNNLLLNSLSAAHDGGRITIAAERREAKILLTYRDDGPGLPAEFGPRIFEPGISGSGDPARGIGLPACRDLLERYGATIEIGEPAGRGACFELTLPVAAATVGKRSVRGDVAREHDPSGLAVLVVDDEDSVREMLAEVLTELGARVTLARDADEADQQFGPGRFTLALLDRNLPGVSGVDLADRLRARDPALAIALMTGWADDRVMAETTARAADLTARKPLTLDRVRELLQDAAELERRRRTKREPEQGS